MLVTIEYVPKLTFYHRWKNTHLCSLEKQRSLSDCSMPSECLVVFEKCTAKDESYIFVFLTQDNYRLRAILLTGFSIC